ncbi:site-2 protease family protein [Archaeoglobales archaeon]|nr:MAG: site-2 protease family protein [Archaeoglobales archaeon]RLI77148.1 MAG: site-2 protease family protein [Archaeoglobales archaeon]
MQSDIEDIEIEKIIEKLQDHFQVYHIDKLPDGYRLYLQAKRTLDDELKAQLTSLTAKYDVRMGYYYGELVLEIRRRAEKKEKVWINIVLLIATFVTTTIMGSFFYQEFNIFGGLMFSFAIMFVLGSHEMGHYFAAKRWGMKTSLPYFIPFPTIIGTLGAVIRHKGPIPNRRALFDVGVSGPLVGIVASCIVIVIGLNIPFQLESYEEGLILGTPILFELLAKLVNFDGEVIHPIAFAGWVGLFVTFLNLIPVGQLDGGHILRAVIGKKAAIISRFMPLVLIVLGSAISYIYKVSDSIWIFWGLITLFFSLQPHPDPIDDKTPLDAKRVLLGIITFILALLCFTPVPFQIAKNL